MKIRDSFQSECLWIEKACNDWCWQKTNLVCEAKRFRSPQETGFQLTLPKRKKILYGRAI